MPRSESARRLGEVLKEISPVLKEARFRKRGSTFNHDAGLGLVHVINFQLERSGDGTFTVNLGVFIPEVYELMPSGPIGDFIPEPACEIRRRLGQLFPQPRDAWWSFMWPTEELAATISGGLKDYGLPYLGRLASREAILREWTGSGNAIGLPPRGRLSIAIIEAHLGKHAAAAEDVAAYRAEIQDRAGTHAGFVDLVASALEERARRP